MSFDLFDTLVDLGQPAGREIVSSTSALHEAVRSHREIDFDAFRRELTENDASLREAYQGRGRELPTVHRFAVLCERLGLESAALPETLTAIHMDLLRSQASAVAHHVALLDGWAGNLRLGCCSNFSHAPTARRVLDEAELTERLDSVVISEEVGIRKPHRGIFEVALAELGVPAHQTLHVGDNLRADVAGAAAVGCATAWVTRRVADPQAALRAYEGPPPDYVVADLAELSLVLGF